MKVKKNVVVDISVHDVIRYILDANPHDLAEIQEHMPKPEEEDDIIVLTDFERDSVMEQLAIQELNDWLLRHSAEEAMLAIKGYESSFKSR